MRDEERAREEHTLKRNPTLTNMGEILKHRVATLFRVLHNTRTIEFKGPEGDRDVDLLFW
ncbi:MAG: hypothetical protein N3F04_06010 [Candidatus Nezhaarchaeota archaeon]|nr:hypothetical protein [Candidatus Nezhaarchaeota archaeon]MCX8142295.1 hypothetical protein [Candidatus Nezhaarchaeota archaeon]MDW8050732.1 hypothetical protein [Nitrososphaerota archaeon]